MDATNEFRTKQVRDILKKISPMPDRNRVRLNNYWKNEIYFSNGEQGLGKTLPKFLDSLGKKLYKLDKLAKNAKDIKFNEKGLPF